MIREVLDNFQITTESHRECHARDFASENRCTVRQQTVCAVDDCCFHVSSGVVDIGCKQSIPIAFPKALQFRCSI